MSEEGSRGIAAELRSLSQGIAEFLDGWLARHDGFGMRSFYGEIFALALLARAGCLTPASERALLRAYRGKDRTDSEYHWEFNQYGLLEAGRLKGPLTFKNTPCTNWTLLRSNVRVRAGLEAGRGLREALAKLHRMQRPSGLILDDPGVRSFQYHCFSAAMVFEMYRETREPRLRAAFERAVAFIRHFILPNGDTLYVGRGQQQSFGYAALAYILSAAYALNHDPELLDSLQRVVRHIAWHAGYDGSLPLVLGGGAEPLPHPDEPHKDSRYPGWYAYNNYFDYLPFAGLFLRKAAEALQTAPAQAVAPHRQTPYRDADFLKVVVGGTIAVLARPGGYWTNDLPVPYVWSGGRVRTSCYGGEQYGGGIYSLRGLPLPLVGSRSIRWRSVSLLFGHSLIVLSPLGLCMRHYEFSERRIVIRTRLVSPLAFRDRYLFPLDRLIVRSQYPLTAAGVEHCASGELQAFDAQRFGEITLEFPE